MYLCKESRNCSNEIPQRKSVHGGSEMFFVEGSEVYSGSMVGAWNFVSTTMEKVVKTQVNQ